MVSLSTNFMTYFDCDPCSQVFFPAITPLYSPVWMKERAKNQHPWYEVNCRVQKKNLAMKPNFMMSLPHSYFIPGSDVIHCQILILYPAVTNSLKRIWQVFQAEIAKVWFPGKILCWLVMSHIGSFLNIVICYKVIKLSRQVENIVLGNNIEEFSNKLLMTNQQRNIVGIQ